MTVGEAQANLDTVIGTMFFFGTLGQVLFDFGSSRSFFRTLFALHVGQELTLLRNKLVVTMPLGEQILRTSVFKGC